MSPAADTHADQRLSGLLRIATAGLIWGTIPLIIRSADGASLVKVFFRILFASVTVGGWMLATGRLGELRGLPREKKKQIVIQGLVLVLNWILFFSALDMTNVATAELLGYTGPVFVAALVPLVTREPFDKRVVLPLALALGGIAVILLPQGLSIDGGRESMGALLAAASAITYAVLLVRSKKLLRGISSATLMMGEYVVGLVALSPFVISAYLRGDVPSSPRAYGALVVLGIVQTALSGFVFLSGLRRVRADHAAVLTYVEPLSAVFFAAAFLHEPLSWETFLGGAMVVAGGLTVARLEARTVDTVPLEMVGIESDESAPTPG